jgi:hypothetical protein
MTSTSSHAAAFPHLKYILLPALLLPILLLCSKEGPQTGSGTSKQQQFLSKLITGFFTVNAQVQKQEPAAGLWVAEPDSLNSVMKSGFIMPDKSLPSDDAKEYAANKVSASKLYARFAIGQVLFLPVKGGAEAGRPVGFSLFKAMNIKADMSHRKYLGEAKGSDKKLNIHFEFREKGGKQTLTYHEGKNVLTFVRMSEDPDVLKKKILDNQNRYLKPVEF